jgi:hypothetical protein
MIGQRLYREIRKTEVKLKAKAKGSQIIPNVTYLWETVATNFEEFQDVSVSYPNCMILCCSNFDARLSWFLFQFPPFLFLPGIHGELKFILHSFLIF